MCAVRVDWDRQPISIHSEDAEELESLILHLRNIHGVKKRSIVMTDHENGGFLFFVYQICHPKWIMEFLGHR